MNKNAMSLKAIVNNIAKKNNIAAQAVLQTYMLERLLERISLSKYKDNFILKGGMLISAMLGIDNRTTMDMDATIKEIQLTKDTIIEIFDLILKIDLNDDISFIFKKIEEIREEDYYNGFRLSYDAIFDNMVVAFKIDITLGDKITPKEIKYKFNLMLEDREIEVWAYNLETIIAEKFETVIRRGVFSTRPRDLYDIYMLIKTQSKNINIKTLKEAITKTAKHRKSISIIINAIEEIDVLKEDNNMIKQWKKYQNDNFYAEGITYEEIIEVLYEIAKW